MAEKFEFPVSQGKAIRLRLSHQGIAEVLGTSRVTVTRILQQLQREGLISRNGRELIWRDREGKHSAVSLQPSAKRLGA